MLHVGTSFSCLHQLTQADFPYVPMTVLLNCSPVITGQEFYICLCKSPLPGWSCLEISLSVTQMEGQGIFVGRIFDEPALGKDMLSFIFYFSCYLSNISALVFRLICVISVAFNQFCDIDFSRLSLLAAVIIYLFIGFIFKYIFH